MPVKLKAFVRARVRTQEGQRGGDRPSHIMDVDEDQNLGIYSNRGLSSVLVINKHLSHQRGGEGEERET